MIRPIPVHQLDVVDQLVLRGYLDRQSSRNDRRKITLEITSLGKSVLDTSYQATQNQLQHLFEKLNIQEQERMLSSLQILRALFASQVDGVSPKVGR